MTDIASTDISDSSARLQNWKLTLAYDGTDFRGWQVQPGEPTIQGELQTGLGRVAGESPLPQGSGRTDAGVHALGQVASFALRAPIPAENLVRALNRTLPNSIRVLNAQLAPPGFHARHSAIAKTYEYRIFLERPWLHGSRTGQSKESATSQPAAVCSPFLARYVWPCSWPLDLDALNQAADQFIGEHDFTSFAAADPDLSARNRAEDHDSEQASPIRTIFSSAWERREAENAVLLVYRVRGNGFLHHMVRNIVGTIVDIGRGYRSTIEIPAILTARSRSAAGPTAPSQGLFLHSVEYDKATDRTIFEPD